ncbi:hypothetical protein [Sinomicrobium soli]|uniref:hypothetical protein n=1 Tax=Sinomicrobium sp. N-1-3-6 TaxID=2219864 RepID=UPI000DCBA21A|nr:hypothetical protein [Sinomicrobium sp. N-1-3-6]RAV27520.1 hypothetical protein DN748_18095 [Sinomicrobium sp. N-1-3-6]
MKIKTVYKVEINIVEQEAIDYAKRGFFDGQLVSNMENLTGELSSKLYNFKRKKDKLFFLNVLRKEVEKQKQEHEKTCKKVNCSFSQEKNMGLFVIDQEIDDISQSYEYEPKYSDEFNPEQQSELYSTLNELKTKLTELGFGQQIIFDELDELKEHLNLGKKNWFQLLKGKLFDLSVSKVLEETVVKEIFKTLSDGFENIPKLIDNI